MILWDGSVDREEPSRSSSTSRSKPRYILRGAPDYSPIRFGVLLRCKSMEREGSG